MSALAIAPKASQEFYEPQRSKVYALVSEATGLVDDVTALVTSYAIQLDLFGSAEWKRYFNQDVGDEPSLPDAFWKFWHSPDAVNPAQKVWQTHLPPVLRPEFVIDLDTKARRDFCLTVMGELIQQPKEGHASRYYVMSSELFRLHGRSEPGPVCWLVMRKDVLARNQSCTSQVQFITNMKADYEAGPSVVDVVTAIFTRFVGTGERHLGDTTGMEGQYTLSCCKETVMDDEKILQVVVGENSVRGLSVLNLSSYSSNIAAIGVVALRKFLGKET